ncbi:MAG: tetratricopeptide repeat protein [Tissierellia bacterium]|nr:tetratricopeptide repeat protein [Tissierellia bacterium]
MASLFWGDTSEEKAKANLRNSLYELRKIFPEEVLTIRGHDYVGINRSVEFTKDIDIFIGDDRDLKILELEDVVFMEKVNIGNYDYYGDWVSSVRIAYEGIILGSLNSYLDKAISSKNIERKKVSSEKIIEIDPYNERAYRELIDICIYNHSYTEGLRYFNKIRSLVEKDLNTKLEKETEDLYQVLKNKEKTTQEISSSDDYERVEIIAELFDEYKKFLGSKPYNNIILSGEMGIGKSRIISNLLEKVQVEIVTLKFYPNDVLSPFRCVDYLFNMYDIYGTEYNLKMRELAKAISKTKKVIYFDSLEFIDFESLKLISNYLISPTNKNLFILGEFNKSCVKDIRFLKYIKNIRNINFIEIEPLTEYQTIEYINKIVDNKSNLDYETIYSKSHGNIMMIRYMLEDDNYAIGTVDEIINSLTDAEYSILQKISAFKYKSTFYFIAKLVDDNEIELLLLLESLLNKGIIVFENDSYVPKYDIIREMAYDRMNPAIALEIHRRIASIIENETNIDYDLMLELKYHYENIGDLKNEIRYEIKALEIRLDYHDQFFPIIERFDLLSKLEAPDKSDVYATFDKLADDLEELRKTIKYEDYYYLKMKIEFLMGRTMVTGGRSKEGIVHINKLIGMAKEIDSTKYLVKGYIEYVHYGIHSYNNEIMHEYIEKLKEIVSLETNILDYAELLRLEGLYETRMNNLEVAEELLHRAIEIYNTKRFETISIVPVAASYNYLGHLYYKKKDYDNAERYFVKAITKCIDNRLIKSLDILFADYGYMLFAIRKYDKAQEVLENALDYFDILGTHWKRPLVESALGIIKISRGELEEATVHMRNAEIFFRKDQKADEGELLEILKARIKTYKMTIQE